MKACDWQAQASGKGEELWCAPEDYTQLELVPCREREPTWCYSVHTWEGPEILCLLGYMFYYVFGNWQFNMSFNSGNETTKKVPVRLFPPG